MTTITHAEMVKQLAKSGSYIISELTPSSAHLLHMAVGISGESSELLEAVLYCDHFDCVDIENLTEELGDIEFYIEGVRQEMGFKREDTISKMPNFHQHGLDFNETVAEFLHLSMNTGKLLDAIKKFAIYTKPIYTENVMDNLKRIEVCLESIRQHFGILYDECIEHNINKLGKRYKGHNYSNEQANDRADKK